MRRINFVAFVVATTVLILFDLYKAAHASFTHDESFTYLHYVNRGVLDIIFYRDPSTNNHILNTLLMKLSQALFGKSELILRLPNILSHLLYLVFTFKLFARYTPKNFILFFVLINANPFLLDFFSLARGYGLAIGLATAGLYYYCRYIENRKQQDHIFSLVLICLASLANFALLYVFLILILVHNYFSFFVFNQPFSLKNIWQANKLNVITAALFSTIFYEPIDKIIKYKLTDFGGFGVVDDFWDDTAGSLLSFSAYCAPYEEIIVTIWKVFIIVFSILFVFRSIKCFLKKDGITATQQFTLLFGMIVFFIVVGSIIQHQLLGTPFLKGRFALFIYPIFILMTVFLVDDLWNSSYKYLIRGAAYLMPVIFFLHTCYTLNASWYYEWQYDMNTKIMLTELAQAKHRGETKISMGITWLFEPSINFYRQIWDIDWLKEVDRNGLKPENDYYYITFDNFIAIPEHESELIRYDPNTKSFLIRHRKKITLKGANNKFVCADGARNNIVIADRNVPSEWETFTILHLENNKCSIRAYNNHFLSTELGQHNEITATRDKIADWEIFTRIELDGNHVAFKAANGKYISVDDKSLQLYARGETIGKQEKFEVIYK